ncbi:MAG: YfhO family protein, partial [Clostridia bacterium]|nr:YfhO family protein [Clostridia bacterium]
VSFAFCGYSMMFYQNIIWLDIMYLFPVLMLGIHSLCEKGKPWLLIFSLSAIVIVNFYISYMVFLFLILYFGIYAVYYSAKDILVFVRLAVSVIISLCISAVVWLPSFVQYTSSGRKSNVLEGLIQCDFFTATETCVPILLSSSLIFAVLLVLLPTLENKSREIKMNVALLFAMCLPVFIEPVNRMWHTGNYMSFPVRYGFITIFLGFIVCAEGLCDIKNVGKGKFSFAVASIIFGLLTGGFVLAYVKENISTISKYAQTLWGSRESYRGILVIFLMLLFCAIIAVVAFKKGLISKKVLAVILAISVFYEAYASLMIYVSPAKNSLNMENYTAFCELEDKIEDDEFYRVNMYEKLIDANMTGAIGYNSLGHYTSLTDSNYMNAVKDLGYSGYWMEIGNWNGNIISDALMAVKYRIDQEAVGYGIEKTPASLGLFIPSDYELPEEIEKTDRAVAIGKIFGSMFSLKEIPVISYDITNIKGCDYKKTDSQHILTELSSNNSIVYDIFVNGEQTLYFDCFNGGSNRLEEPINKSFSVYVNGIAVAQSYPAQNNNGMLELGTFEDESVTVLLQLNKSVSCYSFGVFGFMVDEIKAVAENYNNLKTEINGNSIKTLILADYSGEMFISLPYNEGYKITLDGKKIDYRRCLTGFTAINVNNGGELNISFTPPKFKLGLVLSLVGIVLLVAFSLFNRKIECLKKVLQNSVFGMFLLVFVVFMMAIYIVPIIANLTS